MFLPLVLALQTSLSAGTATPLGIGTATPSNPPVPPPTATSATAARADQPPVLDGKDDDEIWRLAPAITQFRQHDPVEDGEPRFRTEARVGYDARYLYVFVRAYDPAPDSIRGFLSRRDQHTPSDFIHLMVDAYNDKRTGVRLTVNPMGVKRDFSISNDMHEDASWDGVWDVVTAVDAQGWTAEYRVPFSQLRFPGGEDHTFGFAVWRDIARHNERISWPGFRRSRTGLVSQWGEVEGFNGITAPRRLEVVPYSVATNAPRPTSTGFDRQQEFTFGGDLKYGITSNITLDATVNPDFGQVEADPAVLNLSAFEQFFEERRPFFLEGAGIFSFANNLFYSRRVGRAPQLSGTYYDQDNAQNSTILGAAKVTGRTAGGMNVGFLNAVTQRERGAGGATIEPMTNYMVARLQQDLRGGNSGVGLMLTSTNRALDGDSRDYLRENAYAVGLDARHRFWNNNYQVSGSIVGSRVEGSPEAMIRTQRSSVHQFQRPDSRLRIDSSATSLSGTRINLGVGKSGGGITRFNFGATRTSAGYETNDAGFLSRADILQNGNWVGLQWQQPTAYFRQMYVNFNQWNDWNTEGTHLNSGANVNINGQFKNQWWFWTGWNVNGFGASFDDRAARGGPVVRRNVRQNGWLGFETDNRNAIVAVLQGYFVLPDEGGTTEFGVDPEMRFRIASNVRGSIGVGINKGTFDAQWYGNVADGLGGTDYTFARLEQTTTSVTTRVDYTMTPTLSLQVYAQPFVTAGKYSDLRELVDGRALRHDDRYAPYAGTLQDFNFKQFRSNTVLRWEYRPGSVLFLVWQQGRGQGDRNLGSFDLGRDLGDLFKTRSDNTFLIKGSYWFSL